MGISDFGEWSLRGVICCGLRSPAGVSKEFREAHTSHSLRQESVGLRMTIDSDRRLFDVVWISFAKDNVFASLCDIGALRLDVQIP